MLTTKELSVVWADIKKAYEQTRLMSPRDTIDVVLKEHKLEDVTETFSAVAHIKKDDGRIYGENRRWISSIPVAQESYEWFWGHPEYKRFNEFVQEGGFDDIHTSHLNQLIGELYKLAHEKEVSS